VFFLRLCRKRNVVDKWRGFLYHTAISVRAEKEDESTDCNHHHHTTTVLQPLFWDHPSEPVPEENFWTLWCKGRLTEADALTIRLGATPSGVSSAHLRHPTDCILGK